MRSFKHKYLISSERAMFRNDEYRNELRSNKVYEVGDTLVLDGLVWYVEMVLG